MQKYSLSFKNLRDPYAFLAELIIYQALYDIRCYYNRDGTKEEIKSGRKAEKWIMKNDRWFRLYAGATNRTLEYVYRLCIEQINIIKKEADVRRIIPKKIKPGQMGRSPNIEMVPEEH